MNELIISWDSIIKALISGLGVYIIFPLVLMLRDAVIWKAVNTLILTDELYSTIRSYAIRSQIWNHKFADKKVSIRSSDGITLYFVEEKSASKEEYNNYVAEQDKLLSLINKDQQYIARKKALLNLVITNYKQQFNNPISKLVDDELEVQKQRYNDSI